MSTPECDKAWTMLVASGERVVGYEFAVSLEERLNVAVNALIKINHHKHDAIQRNDVALLALRRISEIQKSLTP